MNQKEKSELVNRLYTLYLMNKSSEELQKLEGSCRDLQIDTDAIKWQARCDWKISKAGGHLRNAAIFLLGAVMISIVIYAFGTSQSIAFYGWLVATTLILGIVAEIWRAGDYLLESKK